MKDYLISFANISDSKNGNTIKYVHVLCQRFTTTIKKEHQKSRTRQQKQQKRLMAT